MIVEYIRYRVPAGAEGDFEQALRNGRELLEKSPHCQGYELSRCIGDPESYIFRILWDSTEGHLKGFRETPEFKAFLESVKPFLQHVDEIRHYEVTSIHRN